MDILRIHDPMAIDFFYVSVNWNKGILDTSRTIMISSNMFKFIHFLAQTASRNLLMRLPTCIE